MKNLLLLLLMFGFVYSITADDSKYEKAMKKTLELMDSANDVQSYVDIANKFERIALAENDKWLPYYYSALNQALASFSDSDVSKKDSYLDKAVKLLEVADSLQPDESEIYTLLGMIAQARLQVDPMNRWAKYGAESNAKFQKAKELDPLNPRPEYLMGLNLYYTPVQFGGGPKAAKPLLEKSLQKFGQSEKSEDLMPHWGQTEVERILNEIKEIEAKESMELSPEK